MSKRKFIDWKDVADSYFEKSMSLAVLLVLFTFLVFPKIEVKPFEQTEVRQMKAAEIPPEVKEKIKPPAEVKKPKVEIVIDDNDMGGDDEELELIDTIESTTLDPFEELEEPDNKEGTTERFQAFEEAPVPIKRVPIKYPAFEKQAGIEGMVVIDVEVFADGTVGKIEVVKSVTQGLDKAVVNAFKQFRFKPAMNNGKPVAVWIRQPVNMTLDD